MGILRVKRFILSVWILICTSFSVFAAPSSPVAWTPETLKRVRNGNPVKGRELAQGCIGCHGERGQSTVADFPSLAGQLVTYTFKQLSDYRSKSRSNPIMNSIATGLSEQDMADLAAWFNSLPVPEPESEQNDDMLAIAENIVFNGDNKRILTPCAVCHGSDGLGEARDTPALAGQSAIYLEKTLNEYKTGERHNDIYGRMRLITEQLSQEEIKQLALYYQSLDH